METKKIVYLAVGDSNQVFGVFSTKEEATDHASNSRLIQMKVMSSTEYEDMLINLIKEQVTLSPFDIVENPHYNKTPTPYKYLAHIPSEHSAYYKGCGEGYAFILDNKVVAFSYKNDTPSDLTEFSCYRKRKVSFSAHQILFED